MRTPCSALAFGFGAALAVSGARAAVSDYQGAWVLSGHDCQDVYASAGKKAAFKKPLDMFAPAFIISGRRLTTPAASCQIRSARPAGDRELLHLDCANAVAANEVRVLLAASPPDGLKRYYGEHDPTGVDYRRCSR
ncbi:hypothetical protein [Methylobacterium sp. 17Sr1-1]|uniref:hypothetical protein n=1 Tax=Methylobacterium sp. 17Sr1-1 TaxID=2202826 RepID=UPI000D6EE806|nr:hypothetical protein [Methylobacterium sp. 17Sr1-1]AWN51046.1 hypothetical protein DK412_04385 [Methylobacterium sp. 17Sr1-1]